MSATEAKSRIRVVCGANDTEVELTGQTVATVRQQLAEALNIPKDAQVKETGSKG